MFEYSEWLNREFILLPSLQPKAISYSFSEIPREYFKRAKWNKLFYCRVAEFSGAGGLPRGKYTCDLSADGEQDLVMRYYINERKEERRVTSSKANNLFGWPIGVYMSSASFVDKRKWNFCFRTRVRVMLRVIQSVSYSWFCLCMITKIAD